MIRLACKIPKKVTLACSGGKDSMSALSFLLSGKRDITVAYYDHGTNHGREAFEFLRAHCDRKSLTFIHDRCTDPPTPGESKEAYWRSKRYEFFKKVKSPIITAHHLNDAVEWWIFSSLRGKPSLMPIERKNPQVIRPFLLSSKKDLHHHLRDNEFVQDPSNEDVAFSRNYIRHQLKPMCLNVNPGLQTTVKNLYRKS